MIARSIYAISSTRLRHELEKPFGKIELFYGENELFKPDDEWFKKMEIKGNIYPNEDHILFQKKEIAEDICRIIIQKIK